MTDAIEPVPVVRPPIAAMLLGYAGLLPPIIAVAVRLIDPAKGGMMLALALFYAALILSFLGGMWWGAVSARVSGAALSLWLAIAVVPSLVALAAGAVLFASVLSAAAIVAAGLLGSLLVDMALIRAGHVPTWWMKLRVPLSVGLAALTLLTGLLAQP
ncbi:DUF3429 domain-containing protein [Sphingomonas sp. Leaf10]|uniref:DUF3429 domain-containing protein n=1 Tax=Sphingomonas sp. Leaf10 TaxID=1735676 RepID=UPI0006F326FD|nr:DUF3429 domain-containing protein [Sphingomonas sp. Leaf10]KQM36403.1 hypothetical protein ASE59_04890 [Sphingomonas sp. Leaf10]